LIRSGGGCRPLLYGLFGALLWSGCARDDPDDGNGDNEPEYAVKGFGLSWPGHPGNPGAVGTFFEQIAAMGDAAVMSNCAWRDDVSGGSDAGAIPSAALLVVANTATYDYTPVQVFGWRSGTTLHLRVPTDTTDNWTNTAARELFAAMTVQFAIEHSPPYLFLGNENSSYYEQNAADYANWLEFYETTYPAVKAASPETRLGVVFNYEHLAGIAPNAGYDAPWWEALTDHNLELLDLIGITTYPFLVYDTPQEVPPDYLQPLFDRIGTLPIVITETGWPAAALGSLDPPWLATEQAQGDFVERLPEWLGNRGIPLLNWLHLYYWHGSGTAWEVFGSVSFYDENDEPRPALQTWLDLIVEQ